ncbi:MAG TPA: hypothetical protein VKB19_15225 [Pedobacter sp.]|nr:hypothetical protein [Pedobacter sp.]
MKKYFVVLSLLAFTSTCFAQTNIFPTTGKVGVGTLTPTSQIHGLMPSVSGSEKLLKLQISDAANDYFEIANMTNGSSTFVPSLKGNVTSINNSALFLVGETDNTNDNGTTPLMVFSSRYASAVVANRPLFGWTNYNIRHMTMLANGNLGLGIENPAEKLAVKGKIRAQEIKVELTGWADFVFAKDYKLPTLQETENHIREKGHLPGIPSAAEVQANGVELGDMNKKLLQKIEELTLHMIEMKKEITELKAKFKK